ncbi:ArsR/SmtB family transcription factor [Pseudaminobacter soli (ex Li et al. 2025)]|uniref:Transcriptional regulator n=1 Tax=Pseudaminobacter soli (ex Li et al. 2025) TaxID=1295366 RepID=A0A2P7SGM1_9HYPH|nr:transcriptional regulator [Mesorhizobium soli]
MAARFAALSHPARIEILRYLSGSNACCCKDVVARLDLAQSTVSQHLKILVDAGLVRFSPEKQRSRYEVDHAALTAFSRTVAGLVEHCCAGGEEQNPKA